MLPLQRNPCTDCKSAQDCTTIGGIPYDYPKLHPGPCSSVGMHRGQTDTQTDTQTRVTTIDFASSTTHAITSLKLLSQVQSSRPQKATPCTKARRTMYRSLRSLQLFLHISPFCPTPKIICFAMLFNGPDIPKGAPSRRCMYISV